MKYRRLICAALLIGISLPALAEVGDMGPVTVEPHLGLMRIPIQAHQPKDFTKPAEGDGTVNPKAKIAKLETGDGNIMVAIDSKSPDAKRPDVIRLDFTGKGKFDDKCVIPLKCRRTGLYQIGPAMIEVPVDGKSIPVQVMGNYQHQNKWRYLNLYFGTALLGQCTFGEKVYPVYLVDGTNNLKCTDPIGRNKRFGNMPYGDRVYVGLSSLTRGKADRKETFFGQPVQVDGKWYELKVSDDLKITSVPTEVEMTKAKIPHEKWSVTLVGKRFTLNLSGGEEPFDIPVDTYRAYQYRQQSTGVNARMQLYCYMSNRETPIVVKPGEVNELKFGAPLKAKLDAHMQGKRQVNLALNLTDASGMTVSSLTNAKGSRPTAPKFEIFDESGKKVYGGKMEFG